MRAGTGITLCVGISSGFEGRRPLVTESAIRRSKELFESGYFCAESVLMAIAESRGVSCKLIPRIATGFCSGLARTGALCGAIGGAILALGMAAGRDSADESVDPTYDLVRQVLDGFESRFRSTTCMGLTGCDLGTDEGQRRFRERSQHETCTEVVGAATRLALEAIERRSG
jgi:C_GCAxxG_C_C family probable redox protein